MDPALHDAIQAVRALGYGIGLHTAGMYPRRLAEVLPWVDWVGMDIKATQQAYDTVTRVADSARAPWTSAELVLASGVAHEFRTTVHPALHTPAAILALAQTLRTMGVRNFVLQAFRGVGCLDDSLNAATKAAHPDDAVIAQVTVLFERFTLRRE